MRQFAVPVLLTLILAALAIPFMFPLVWLVSSSLKTERQVYAFPPELIPSPFVFDNYPAALAVFPFWVSLRNTMVIMAGVMAGHLFTCSFTAYIFARLRFPLRNALFVTVLSTLMIPYHVYLIPQYLLFRELGWLNSPKPLIVPQLLGQAPFFIFLMRQFFRTIPTEYDDAARLDGLGWLGIYWRIIMPLSKPVLGTTAILTFMGVWNDYLGPLIYLNEPSKQTLAIAMSSWISLASQTGSAVAPWNYILAIAGLITLPPMLLFFFAQRYFIQGVVVSGLKG
jgi:multiple sugar transport system permease protein